MPRRIEATTLLAVEQAERFLTTLRRLPRGHWKSLAEWCAMTQPGVHCAALAHVERALTTPGILRRRRELRGRVRVIVRRAARSYGLNRATSDLLERHCVGAALAILAGPALEPPAFGTLYHGFDVLVPLDALGEPMAKAGRRSES